MSVRNSERTEQLKVRLFWLRTVDILMLVFPLFYYFCAGLASGEAVVYQKVALVGTIALACVICGINVIFKFHLRFPIWVALIGLHVALGNVLPLLIILAVLSAADECVLTPLIKKTKVQLVASKEFDRRH